MFVDTSISYPCALLLSQNLERKNGFLNSVFVPLKSNIGSKEFSRIKRQTKKENFWSRQVTYLSTLQFHVLVSQDFATFFDLSVWCLSFKALLAWELAISSQLSPPPTPRSDQKALLNFLQPLEPMTTKSCQCFHLKSECEHWFGFEQCEANDAMFCLEQKTGCNMKIISSTFQ